MDASKRKQTTLYIVIYSVLVLGIAAISPLLGGSPASPGLGFMLWGTAPLLVAVLMRLVTRDWSDVGMRPGIRRNALWSIVSILAFPFSMVLSVFMGSLVQASSVSGFSLIPYFNTFLAALPMFFIFAIFEEFGWRGYLGPKLASLGINDYLAYAIVGVVWATWHMPYIRELTWVYAPEDLTSFVPRFYAAMFVSAIVFGEIRKLTGTFWPAVIMHAVGNAFGHPLAAEFIKIAPGKEYLGSVGNSLFFIALMLILGVAINRWRQKRLPVSDPTALA
jgi:membrane protease YdiL (CAAX protease family)